MQVFGTTKKGEEASLYTLKNGSKMEVKVTNYGASLVQLWLPDRRGELVDVVAGYDDAAGYERGTASIGATVGRVANRIEGASFELNGKTYSLTANDNGNTLHGGRDFYNHRIWETVESDDTHVKFRLFSPDGDQGFPGNLEIFVTYTLAADHELQIHYEGVSDADTLVNMTNHSYFNLAGHAAGSVYAQEVMIDADAYTMADAASIPTGELVPVQGTPMDFRRMKQVGSEIDDTYEALILGHGYDHNWVLNGTGWRKAAEMYAETTGIGMEVFTDLPGIQLYSSNFLEHESGKGGVIYGSREALCFETQYFPDAVHKENFEGPVLKAGEAYNTITSYRFYVK